MKKIFKNNWILAYKKQGVYHLIISGHEMMTERGSHFEKIKFNGDCLKLYSNSNEFIIHLTGPISLFPIQKRFEKIKELLSKQECLQPV